uniref:NADH-ubiquinone oxidoreductase chain 2 n=1 Tax=Potamanthellus edmundsi TaxID=2680887 RepID=A0A8K1VAL8_9INSE|nr:NADH dehydrogenase subunit 2 [Potamanthellus edmundsi]
MLINPTSLLFFITLVSGTLISISSSSWFGVWAGLEINLLSFIPLMTQYNQFTAEAALKYFLIQALASSLLLLFVVVSYMTEISLLTNFYMYSFLMLSSALFMKMGAAPFHFWFPNVMEGLNWMSGLLLMTWQKIAPLMLMTYLTSNTTMFIFIIISSVTAGAISGLNQTSLRKIMAFSSISHLGWLLIAILMNESSWVIYMLFYMFMSFIMVFMFNNLQLSHINQIFNSLGNNQMLKMLLLFTNLLSLGGLPPFLGFGPKWMLIQLMSNNNLYLLLMIMIFMNLITLYFYLRLTYSAFILTNLEFKWIPYTHNCNMLLPAMMTSISTLGLLISQMMLYYV